MRLLLPAMIVAVSMVAVPHGEEPLHYVGSIELARVEGRIDHLAFDAVHQRLFVAALGNNTVEVIEDFHRVRSVVLGDDSDNARYDSEARLPYRRPIRSR